MPGNFEAAKAIYQHLAGELAKLEKKNSWYHDSWQSHIPELKELDDRIANDTSTEDDIQEYCDLVAVMQELFDKMAMKKQGENMIIRQINVKADVEVEEGTLPYLHPNIPFSALHENGKVLNRDQILLAEQEFAKNPEANFLTKEQLIDGLAAMHSEGLSKSKKKELVKKFKYDVARVNGQLYAICNSDEIKPLGEGGFGEVSLTQNLTTGEFFVVKRTVFANEGDYFDSLMEQKNLAELKQLQGGLVVEGKEEKAYTFMPLAEGITLKQMLMMHRRLPAVFILDVARKAIAEIQRLHAQGFLHNDVKLENFIWDPATHTVKLVDYGFALQMNPDGTARGTTAGSYSYMAPELKAAFDNKIGAVTYSEKTEVYALGKLLEELFGYYREFRNKNAVIFAKNKDMRAALNDMTSDAPEKRPKLAEVSEYLDEVYNDCVPLAYRTVGVIDVEEYLASKKDAEKREQFFNALKQVDLVYVRSKEKIKTPEQRAAWLEMRRELESAGIALRNYYLVAEHMSDLPFNAPREVVADERQSGEDKGAYTPKAEIVDIKQYFYFTANVPDAEEQAELADKGVRTIQLETKYMPRYYKEEIDKPLPLIEEHVKQIQDILQQEMDRLRNKKPYKKLLESDSRDFSPEEKVMYVIVQHRLEILKDAKENVSTYTYKDLFDNLEKLQSSMRSTRSKTGTLFKLFGEGESTGTKKLKKFKEEFEETWHESIAKKPRL